MGLGLSISRTVVASHGGTLTIESTPGLGTTCRVEFPRMSITEVEAAPDPTAATRPGGMVFVVDDEPSMRRAVERRLLSVGYQVASFASAEAFLASNLPHELACLVCDMRMPGMNGLELQAAICAAGREMPIVFMSGYGDVRTTVRALKAGAVSFLSKPFTKGELLDSVQEALRWSGRMNDLRRENADLQQRYSQLTPRERQVLSFVVEGALNKVIAARLGAAETTVKIHRGRVMEKMGATSVPDLVRMAERLGVRATVQPETA
jgi:FixJ family two-component response regulator